MSEIPCDEAVFDTSRGGYFTNPHKCSGAFMASFLPSTGPMHANGNAVSLFDVSPTEPTIDAIFQAFDGRDYDVDGDTCHIAVYGVYDAGDCKWVQLAVDGPTQKLVTLRLYEGPSGLISKLA